MLKLKQGKLESVATSDFWYDLFDGGYIEPEDFLDEKSAEKVSKAMDTLREYQNLLENNDLTEEM